MGAFYGEPVDTTPEGGTTTGGDARDRVRRGVDPRGVPEHHPERGGGDAGRRDADGDEHATGRRERGGELSGYGTGNRRGDDAADFPVRIFDEGVRERTGTEPGEGIGAAARREDRRGVDGGQGDDVQGLFAARRGGR